MEVQYDSNTKTAFVYENSNMPLTGTYSLSETGTANQTEQTCSSEQSCDGESENNASDSDIFDNDAAEDIGVVVKARGDVTGCIVCSVERIVPEKHRVKTMGALIHDDLDMESEDENGLQCNLCHREFSTASKMKLHACRGAIGQQD